MKRIALIALVLASGATARAEFSQKCSSLLNSVLGHEKLGSFSQPVARGKKGEATVSRQVFTYDYYKKLEAKFGKRKGALNPNSADELKFQSVSKKFFNGNPSEMQAIWIGDVETAQKREWGVALWNQMVSGSSVNKAFSFGASKSVKVLANNDVVKALEVVRGSQRYVFKFGSDCAVTDYSVYSNFEKDDRQSLGSGLSSNCPKSIPPSTRDSEFETKYLVCKVINGGGGGGARNNGNSSSPRSR